MLKQARTALILPAVVAGLGGLTGLAARAGDFSNPVPYNADAGRSQMDAAERMRLAYGTGGPGSYILGDYYKRYQNGANWNNAVLSGNTIILNGDNNNVTLTTDGSTVTQSSNGTCQSTSNTFLNDGGTTAGTSVNCDTPE